MHEKIYLFFIFPTHISLIYLVTAIRCSQYLSEQCLWVGFIFLVTSPCKYIVHEMICHTELGFPTACLSLLLVGVLTIFEKAAYSLYFTAFSNNLGTFSEIQCLLEHMMEIQVRQGLQEHSPLPLFKHRNTTTQTLVYINCYSISKQKVTWI